MDKIKQVIAIIQFLKPLLTALETLIPGSGQGATKKALAMQIINAILTGADAFGPLIDTTVATLNKDGWPDVVPLGNETGGK